MVSVCAKLLSQDSSLVTGGFSSNTSLEVDSVDVDSIRIRRKSIVNDSSIGRL